MAIVAEAKNIDGKVEMSTGRRLWWQQDIIYGLYKDLAADGQPDDVKEYLRLLIKQLESVK